MKQIKVKVLGHVQGVFFRATTLETARKLGLSGWVENCSDGSVEAVFAGSDDALGQILIFCLHGPERARVDQITAEETQMESLPQTFEIRR